MVLSSGTAPGIWKAAEICIKGTKQNKKQKE